VVWNFFELHDSLHEGDSSTLLVALSGGRSSPDGRVVVAGETMKSNALGNREGRDFTDSAGDIPTREECRNLLSRFAVSEEVVAHSEMVAEFARILAIYLNRAGLDLRVDLIVSAGLLHGIVRGTSDDAEAGACLLRQLGYVRVANILSLIVKVGANGPRLLDESDLVYFADRYIEKDRPMPLGEQYRLALERFAAYPEILNAACRRLNHAVIIKRRIENILGWSVGEIVRKHRKGLQAAASNGPRDIYLLRHGAIRQESGGGRRPGQSDLSLSPAGRRQAEELSRDLGAVRFSAVYCSDLRQSFETAAIVAEPHCLHPRKMEELREVSFGLWEGLSSAEVSCRYPRLMSERESDVFRFRPPDGESYMDCVLRVISALYRILCENRGNVLVVGHETVNRIILCQAAGVSAERLFDFKQDYGCLNVIGVEDSVFTLKVLNRWRNWVGNIQ